MDDRVSAAISRLVTASDMSWQHVGAPLYACASGGKDSTVLQQLADIRAFDAMIQRRRDEGRPLYFETGKEQFDFWMERG